MRFQRFLREFSQALACLFVSFVFFDVQKNNLRDLTQNFSLPKSFYDFSAF